MRLWHLILAGVAAVALRRASDVFLLPAVAATIATGVMLAVRISPALASLRDKPRFPSPREWLSISAGLAVAYIGFGILDEIFGVLEVSSSRDVQTAAGRANLAGGLLLPLWLLAAVLPAGLQFLRRGSLQQ